MSSALSPSEIGIHFYESTLAKEYNHQQQSQWQEDQEDFVPHHHHHTKTKRRGTKTKIMVLRITMAQATTVVNQVQAVGQFPSLKALDMTLPSL
jgi:hypothetical protein